MYNVVHRKVSAFRKEHEVALSKAQARAMGNEILDGNFLRHIRIVHLEFGDVFGDLIVPVQFTLIGQYSECSACKTFGIGGNPHEGIFVHLIPCCQ